MKNTVTIELPKVDSIFLNKRENKLYLYRGFNTKINGHALVGEGKTPEYVDYVFVCHDEFKKSYMKVGKL